MGTHKGALAVAAAACLAGAAWAITRSKRAGPWARVAALAA
jgi:hypothetical protein